MIDNVKNLILNAVVYKKKCIQNYFCPLITKIFIHELNIFRIATIKSPKLILNVVNMD